MIDEMVNSFRSSVYYLEMVEKKSLYIKWQFVVSVMTFKFKLTLL